MTDNNMEAKIIFDSHIPTSLRRALDYAGNKGYVASMPKLLHGRANADYDNIIWNTWFTSYTEDNVVNSANGNRVVVTVHGGGIFASPDRFERLYNQRENLAGNGFTGQHSGKITDKEALDVLEGRLPCGTEIPIYTLDEYKNKSLAELPIRHGIVRDYELARKSTRGYDPFDVLREEPNFICHAGGMEAAARYLDKAQARHNTEIMGNWHPYNRVDPDQNQTRIVFLAGNEGGVCTEDDDDWDYGYDAEYGLGGDACMHNMARFIAVAPKDELSGIRHLNFETSD